MKDFYKIPNNVLAYKEGDQKEDTLITEAKHIIYEPTPHEFINVLLWERYPSYDIIFGVPNVTSPRHEKEVGFFTIRRAEHTEHVGFYFDIKESQAMVEGFSKILEMSKTHSPHLWVKHSQ